MRAQAERPLGVVAVVAPHLAVFTDEQEDRADLSAAHAPALAVHVEDRLLSMPLALGSTLLLEALAVARTPSGLSLALCLALLRRRHIDSVDPM